MRVGGFGSVGSRAAPEKGLRMRGDISLDEAEYAGRATSRKKFAVEDEDDGQPSDESEEDPQASDESEDEDGNEGGFSILDMDPEEQQRMEEEPGASAANQALGLAKTRLSDGDRLQMWSRYQSLIPKQAPHPPGSDIHGPWVVETGARGCSVRLIQSWILAAVWNDTRS